MYPCHHPLCCNLCVTQKGICTNISLSDVIPVQHLNNGSSFLWLLLFELFLWGPWTFELCGLCSLLKPSILLTQREGGTTFPAEQAGTPNPSTVSHPHDEVQAFQPLPTLQLITKTISLWTGPVLSCLCVLPLSAQVLSSPS